VRALAQVNTLSADWARFKTIVHFHHEHEETLVFPFMAKRIVVPPKLGAGGPPGARTQHRAGTPPPGSHSRSRRAAQELVALLDACGAGIAAVQPTDAGAPAEAGLRSLLASFVAFETSMRAHLLEEEEVGLPLLRHHFSSKEFTPVEK
jgi:hypothetical protein